MIRHLMLQLHPQRQEGLDWHTISFSGKADLEKNCGQKIKSWNYNNPTFIIMRDNDGADCIALKARLECKVQHLGKPYKIRLVCQELESWFLGDLTAVQAAYPASNALQNQSKATYRDPDSLTNASELLSQITGTKAKVGRAQSIAKHLSLAQNTSTSFNVFLQTL